jgi:hypothetical protein
MAVTTAAIVGSAVIGAAGSAYAAKKGSSAQVRAANTANAEQARQFDLARADLAPYREAGTAALGTLSSNFGNSFETSPGYEFVRDEGQRNLGNSFAARGGAFSGNALRALSQFNQGLASQEYGNWWNRGAELAGIGQTATNTGVAAGQNYANQFGANTMAAGDARASGVLNAYSGITNAANTGLNNYLLHRGGYFGFPGQSYPGSPPISSGGSYGRGI